MSTTAFQLMKDQPPIQATKPASGTGDDRVPEAPQPPAKKDASGQPDVGLTDEMKKDLTTVINRYCEMWFPVRRRRVRRCLKAREYLVGNQYVSFDPSTFMWYDPIEAMFDNAESDEDDGVYRYVNNLYQSLYLAFVASLSGDTPRTEFLPNDANQVIDVTTADIASSAVDIIERQNKIRRLLKCELGLLWTDPGYWKYTRFVVDSSIVGTRQEPKMAMVPITMGDEYHCQECGHDTPAQRTAMLKNPACEACGNKVSGDDYYPPQTVMAPKITGYDEIPNGMVKWDVYGLLNITTAPYANELLKSPLLKLDEDVDMGSIRTSYPDFWEQIQITGGTTSSTQEDRFARQRVIGASASGNVIGQTQTGLPTLSRTWVQNFAFGILDDKERAQKLQKQFPDGCMVVHQGDLVLEVRPAKMADYWSWTPAFLNTGQIGPAVGDAGMDVQDQYNDEQNMIIEFFDRCASPSAFIDEARISTKKLNNKKMLAGALIGVKSRRPDDNRALGDAFHQPQMNIHDRIFNHADGRVLFAELVTGVLPQTFGGSQEHIDTFGGQKQALNVALGKLGLFWELIREEHADSAGKAVRCAAKNYTQDMLQVLRHGKGVYENQYVRIGDLRGDFHEHPETDQGIPATFGDMRDRLERMFELAAKNPWLQQMMDVPENAAIFAQYLAPRGLVIPGQSTRMKVLKQIDILMQSRPTPRTVVTQTAQGPQPVTLSIPSVRPNPTCDDMEIVVETTSNWMVDNFEQESQNPPGYANVQAYLLMAQQMQMQKARQEAMQQAAMAPPGSGGPPALGGQP